MLKKKVTKFTGGKTKDSSGRISYSSTEYGNEVQQFQVKTDLLTKDLLIPLLESLGADKGYTA